jgi:protein ATS1
LGIGGSKKGKEKQTSSFHFVRFDHLTVDGMSINTKSIVIRSLAAGQHHVIVHLQVILSNGSSRLLSVGWGTARHGQLGNVNTQDTKMPPFVSVPHVVSSDDLKDPTVSVSLGTHHTAFLRTSGKVAGLGSNRKGQLQGIEIMKGVTKLGCTWNGTYILLRSEDGDVCVLATGSYSQGQLGRALHDSSELSSIAPVDFRFSASSHRVIDMACGSEHVLVLVSVGGESVEVWGWGWNEHGNLGTGLTENVLIPIKVWPNNSGVETSQKVAGIWAGSGTSWIYVTT